MNVVEVLLLCGALVAMVMASRETSPDKFQYGGMYKGTCEIDGIYWMGWRNYAVCKDGHTYNMPCAPGTRNADASEYTKNAYAHWEFCNVRLPIHRPRSYKPIHAQAHVPVHAPTHAPTHAPVHAPTHAPVHARAHAPVHARAHAPAYAPAHAPTYEHRRYSGYH